MKVLVTGAAGYIGSTLCPDLLNLGHEVVALDNFNKGHADALIPCAKYKGFTLIKGDIRDEKLIDKLMPQVDAVIHLAALVGAPACSRDPWLSYSTNVVGTTNLLKHREYEIPFIYSSTGSNYGKVEGICTENSPCNPLSEYGLHKYEAERFVVAENNTVSLRFATAYGVSPCMRVNLLVNDLVSQAIKNKGFTLFQSDFRRTFIHVRDMSRSFIWALDKLTSEDKPKYKVYNTGGEVGNCTKRDLAEYLKKKIGCEVVYGDSGVDPDQRDYEVDYSRIRSEGFELKYTMEEGIDELIRVIPILSEIQKYN
jgi:nucleoside-diphosphate-sugar epimerase